MPTTNIDQRVKRIISLSDAEVTAVKGIGIDTEDDLRFSQFVDFPAEIPVIKRRKLELITRYLANGNALDATITMIGIQEALNAPPAAAVGPGPGHIGAADPSRGAPKVYTDPLSNFSGDAVDFEEWERKAGATMKQTVYKDFLTRPATPGDAVEEARSKEFYNMILSCVADGHALNTIEKVRDDNDGLECGYLAWKALNDWYLDPTQIDSMINHWERKLSGIALDQDTSATEYINNFEMYVRKLVKLGENWSDDKKIREFKKGVTDDDYDTEVRVHTGNFEKLIETVRQREQHLQRSADHRSRNNKRTTRRVRAGDDSDDEEQKPSKSSKRKTENDQPGKSTSHIPFIPKFLFSSLKGSARTNVATWRRMTNKGETMGKDDLVHSDDEKEKDKDPEKPSNKTGKKKKGSKTRRVTRTRRLGIQDDTVEVKLASSDSEYSTTFSSNKPRERFVTFGNDSVYQFTPDQCIKDEEGFSIRMLKKTTSIGMSRGSSRFPPYAVIDPGAEKEVIGGVGWKILHFSDRSEALNGALAGMGTEVLPTVDAVTTVKDTDGRVILLFHLYPSL